MSSTISSALPVGTKVTISAKDDINNGKCAIITELQGTVTSYVVVLLDENSHEDVELKYHTDEVKKD